MKIENSLTKAIDNLSFKCPKCNQILKVSERDMHKCLVRCQICECTYLENEEHDCIQALKLKIHVNNKVKSFTTLVKDFIPDCWEDL